MNFLIVLGILCLFLPYLLDMFKGLVIIGAGVIMAIVTIVPTIVLLYFALKGN